MNNDAVESLAPDQQSLLREAAVAAIPTALAAARAEDAEAAPVLCRRGLNFASASESDVAELRSALEPVYAELAKDPETKAAIDAIASAQVAGRCLCGDTRVPIGLDICVGRGIADRRQLRDHGHRADWVARGLDPGAYPVGVFTMIFDSGELTILEPNGQTGLEASYTVFRDQIEVEGGVDRFTARWALDGEQLTFTDIDVAGVEGGGEPYIVGVGVASLGRQSRGRRQSDGGQPRSRRRTEEFLAAGSPDGFLENRRAPFRSGCSDGRPLPRDEFREKERPPRRRGATRKPHVPSCAGRHPVESRRWGGIRRRRSQRRARAARRGGQRAPGSLYRGTSSTVRRMVDGAMLRREPFLAEAVCNTCSAMPSTTTPTAIAPPRRRVHRTSSHFGRLSNPVASSCTSSARSNDQNWGRVPADWLEAPGRCTFEQQNDVDASLPDLGHLHGRGRLDRAGVHRRRQCG